MFIKYVREYLWPQRAPLWWTDLPLHPNEIDEALATEAKAKPCSRQTNRLHASVNGGLDWSAEHAV